MNTLLKEGSEFQVNTYTTQDQISPSVTNLKNGGFVVTWTSIGQDGDGYGIYGHRYDSNGNRVGDEFPINSVTKWGQLNPSVTGLNDGTFVVTWQSDGQDGDDYGVYGQLFDSHGNKVGAEFQVNTYTTQNQISPSVTNLKDGGFVVTWQSDGQDGNDYGVYGQRFDSNGNRVDNEFPINSVTNLNQSNPSVTGLNDGTFVVTWQSDGQDGDDYGIYGQRFDSNGNQVDNEFQINTYTISRQEAPSVTGLDNGGFVVTWQSLSQDGSGAGIYGQKFDANGNRVNNEFQINTYIANDQKYPSVTSTADGGFVVTWQSGGNQDGSGSGIFGQSYDSNANAIGSEFQINTNTAEDQFSPSVTGLSDGNFVVTWQSWKQDGSDWGIYGKLYQIESSNTPPIASDDSASTNQNEAVAIAVLANDSDSDGDDLTISNFDSSSTNGGTITLNNDNELVYTPTANFVGEDSFTYTISDGNGGTDTATVTITVNAIHPDFNFDGKRDLVWRNQSTGKNVVWYMDGANRTGFDNLPQVANIDWEIVGTGDANNDQKTDLYWRNQATGKNVVWYMDGATRTGFDNLPTVANMDWQIVGIGDADNDSLIDDIYWRNQATGKNVVWYMDGTTMTSSDNLPTVINLDWEIVGIADGNGDGKTDLYWRNQATGKNVVWYMDGANRTGFDNLPTVANIDWEMVGTGDGNGDGKTDLYWRNQVTGQNVLWYMDEVNRTGFDTLPTVANTDWEIVA